MGMGIGFMELVIVLVIFVPLLWWLFGGLTKGMGGLFSNLRSGAVLLTCPHCGRETDSRKPTCQHCGAELR